MEIQISDRVENIVGKENLIAIALNSNFSFSHNVFKCSLFLMRQNEYLWSKGLMLTEDGNKYQVIPVIA